MRTDRRSELADFLRGRRARATPAIAGLPAVRRRRTPGLRREELAQMAGLSVDWYTRLEQGRDVNPSMETLQAIADALQLNECERVHLFYLASADHPRDERLIAHQEEAEPAMRRAIEVMSAPAGVMSPRLDLLAWNDAVCRLLVPFGELPRAQRNILWLTFRHSGLRARYVDIGAIEQEAVAHFRSGAGMFVGDPHFDSLIAELLQTSESFRALWARHDVRAKSGGTKAFQTDQGSLVVDWHSMTSTTGTRQQLFYYVARAGSGDARRLAELCGM